MDKCILCGAKSVLNRQDNAGRTIYNCHNCGVFVVSDIVEAEAVKNRHKLAAFLVNRHLNGKKDIVLISNGNVAKDKGYVHLDVDRIVNEFPSSVMRRVMLSLKNLVKKSEYPGAEVKIEELNQGPIFYLEKVNFESMSYMISSLEKKGYISVNYYGSSFFPCNIVVTPEGWELASKSEYDPDDQDSVLIVLPGSGFSEDYLKIIGSACRSNGYKIADSINISSEKIGYGLMAKVIECRFIICDVTGQAPEAYYAVGMAKGQNKTVILTCHSKDRGNLKLDTENMSVIFWDDLSSLNGIISNAIRVLIY